MMCPRSIPAWAGEPLPQVQALGHTWVYPRVGGGTRSGYSRTTFLGSIPAWAGEPSLKSPDPPPAKVYPRVGGGTKRNDTPGIDLAGLSPRGRGNQGRWPMACA